MHCLWWYIRGLIHYERLNNTQSVTAEKYLPKLEDLKHAFSIKRRGVIIGVILSLLNRRGVILLHDNTKPHIAKLIQENIMGLGYAVLPRPPYSPNLALSDFHVFRSMQHYLSNKKYEIEDQLKIDLDQFFASKPKSILKEALKTFQNNGKRLSKMKEPILQIKVF